MVYIMLAASIASMVMHNGLSNLVSKQYFAGQKDAVRFNLFMHGLCFVIFGMLTIRGGISLYTLALGLLFGIATALSSIFKMLALTVGPMHITNLFITSSLVVPALSGVVLYREAFSPIKFLLIFLLLFFIYLSMGRKNDTKIHWKWFLYCTISFLCAGAIGVMQKIHQNSSHSGETAAFLATAFLCSLLFSAFGARGAATKQPPRFYGYALICGVCVYAMNHINLILSGILPSQLFFPLVNGSSIVLSSIVSVVVFKETLCNRQAIGLIGGIVTLILFCIF